MTTAEFRWLHSEAWNDAQKATFARFRQGARPANLYAPPPYESGKRRSPPVVVGRWALEMPAAPPGSPPAAATSPLAAVEAQGTFRTFHTLHILVSGCSAAGGWTEQHLSALSLMISAIIIMSRADIVLVIPLEPADAPLLQARGWGEAKSVWSPNAGLYADAHGAAREAVGGRIGVVAVDPHQWWEQEHGARDRVTLAYLEKRLDQETSAARGPGAPRPRPSLLGRLARLFRNG